MIKKPFYFRKFCDQDIQGLYQAFISSFAGNAVKFKPTFAQFENRILSKFHLNDDLSGVLVHKQGNIVGFVLHTAGNIHGILTAYNGGTGVVPEHRGQQFSTQMYEAALPWLQEQGINKVLLEVITTNQPAIRLYESLGFQYTRYLKSFKLHKTLEGKNTKAKLSFPTSFNDNYESFWSFVPAFLDRSQHLAHNLPNEKIIEAVIESQVVGYVIFQPSLGRISQLAVEPGFREQGIAQQLLCEVQALSQKKNLTVMNIPEEEESTISALEGIGFKNEVDQYEMELII